MNGAFPSRLATRAMSIAASILLLAGGVIHLKIWNDGYRNVPNHNLGRSFLVNAAASFALAVLLQVWHSRLVLLASVVVVNATLVGFAMSRTDRGVFGFSERGFSPSPEAALSLIVEIAAAALLLLLLAFESRPVAAAPRR